MGFNKCPGVIFQKLVCPEGILNFALLWGCTFIIWNSPMSLLAHIRMHNFEVTQHHSISLGCTDSTLEPTEN